MENRRKYAGIVGIGSYVPDKILTNFDLEKMVDTSDEWIRTRTGILERRIADEGTSASDLAVPAALKALEDAKVEPGELDLIIVATVTPDMFFPSTACLVQDRIGARKVAAFDIQAGCSGFVYGLAIAEQFICNGAYKTALVIGSEVLSKITDWTDRRTCVLFGDAAGAAVVREVPEGYGLLSFCLGADGSGADLLKIDAGGSRLPASEETIKKRLHYIYMNGHEVFKFAVKIMGEAAMVALEKCGLSPEDVDCLIPHQANIRIIDAAAKRLAVPREKVFVNVDKYGNTSAASIPLALDEAVKGGKIKKGDIVVLTGFGAGLTWAACVMRWQSAS